MKWDELNWVGLVWLGSTLLSQAGSDDGSTGEVEEALSTTDWQWTMWAYVSLSCLTDVKSLS